MCAGVRKGFGAAEHTYITHMLTCKRDDIKKTDSKGEVSDAMLPSVVHKT